MKAKLKFRLNGQTIEKGQEIPKDMLEAAKERGYVAPVATRAPKRAESDE